MKQDHLPLKPQPKEWLAEELCLGKIADYKPYNFVDGEGVRCSLYVSGCPFRCPGCYNLVAQNFNYGIPFTAELADKILDDIAAPYCQGLTLLGGEPFLSTPILIPLLKEFRQRFGHHKDIWAWSGYIWEDLLKDSQDKLDMLAYIDVLVDGPFLLAEKDLTIPFRGSRNQRIIDVPSSLNQNKLVLWETLHP